MLKYLTVALLSVVLGYVNSQSRSPCPELFQYEGRNEPGRWEGVLTLHSDADLQGVWVRTLFDAPFTQLTVADNFAEVVTSDHKDYLIKNREFMLKADEPKKIRIIVNYEGNKVPSLIGFRLNARTVCPSKFSGTGWSDQSYIQQSGDYFLGDLSNKDFLASRPSSGSFQGCGTVPLHPDELFSNNPVKEGQWPWHASLYLIRGKEEGYVCGGTLISPNHLLTAAHCVTQKNSENPLDRNIVKIYLGKHFLSGDNNGLQAARVGDIVLHPGYNSKTFRNDIAIVKFDQAVKITDYVRPACLWEEDGDLSNVIRRDGSIVGWGFDNKGRYTDRLTQNKVAVLDNEKCLRLRPELVSFLSENTLCAGFEKAEPICAGDSGSGLLYLSKGPSPVLQVRAILSVGVALQNEFVCDQHHVTVFTDIISYLKWIKTAIA